MRLGASKAYKTQPDCTVALPRLRSRTNAAHPTRASQKGVRRRGLQPVKACGWLTPLACKLQGRLEILFGKGATRYGWFCRRAEQEDAAEDGESAEERTRLAGNLPRPAPCSCTQQRGRAPIFGELVNTQYKLTLGYMVTYIHTFNTQALKS